MNWSTVQLEAWLVNVMGLPAVAKAAEGDVDGGTAVEMDLQSWRELGATSVKAAKIVSELKKLSGTPR